ncbi:hypothetical protein GXW82_00905 [Streptacidiphilus sp. 4-A2]|nr:hypothetical protein [Streptacidiphilus sp. 4-A2]
MCFTTAWQPSAAPDTVVVRPTEALGPGGHPIYTDDSGTVRAEISDRGEVRMMATAARQELRRPVSCRRPGTPARAQQHATAG